MIATVFIFAGLGALIAMFVGWLLAGPSVAAPQELRIRVAVINDQVFVGVKVGEEATVLKLNR